MEFCVRPPAPDELAQIGMVYDQAAAFQKANGIVQWEPGVYPRLRSPVTPCHEGSYMDFMWTEPWREPISWTPSKELYDRVAWGYPGAPLTVHALAVDQAYQGQGIASLAMEWAEAIAIREGKDVMRVDTNSDNRFAQALFLRCGYRFVCSLTFPIVQRPIRPIIAMRKDWRNSHERRIHNGGCRQFCHPGRGSSL